jgi:hypothetical protein
MFQKLEEISQVRKERADIEEKERALLKPTLTDLSLISVIHGWVCVIASENRHTGTSESVYERKKFLFIVLLLYAPGVLVGDKMPSGLRGKLAEVLRIRSKSVISDNCADVPFLYNRYKDFREETEEVFRGIVERLAIK